MPVFEYTALDSKGKTTSGIIDAEGAQAARQKLRTSGIFPVSIKETLEAAPKKNIQTIYPVTPDGPRKTGRSFNDDSTASNFNWSRFPVGISS